MRLSIIPFTLGSVSGASVLSFLRGQATILTADIAKYLNTPGFCYPIAVGTEELNDRNPKPGKPNGVSHPVTPEIAFLADHEITIKLNEKQTRAMKSLLANRGGRPAIGRPQPDHRLCAATLVQEQWKKWWVHCENEDENACSLLFHYGLHNDFSLEMLRLTVESRIPTNLSLYQFQYLSNFGSNFVKMFPISIFGHLLGGAIYLLEGYNENELVMVRDRDVYAVAKQVVGSKFSDWLTRCKVDSYACNKFARFALRNPATFKILIEGDWVSLWKIPQRLLKFEYFKYMLKNMKNWQVNDLKFILEQVEVLIFGRLEGESDGTSISFDISPLVRLVKDRWTRWNEACLLGIEHVSESFCKDLQQNACKSNTSKQVLDNVLGNTDICFHSFRIL